MDSRIKELFARYQAGTANKAEIEIIEKWFAAYDKEQKGGLDQSQKHALFDQMDQNMLDMFPDKQPTVRHLNYRWLQVAAVIAVAFGLLLFKALYHQPVASLTYTTIAAPNGVKKQYTLADGTTVFINSGSSIRIASNFGQKNREVELTGEAYFDVIHNAAKPFSIRTGQLRIADIGTAFNIKAYPADDQIKVAVESGIVSIGKIISDSKTDTYAKSVTRNQQFTYHKRNKQHELINVEASDAAAWKRNQLRFDNASVEEIAGQIERWYNVRVRLENNTGTYRRYTLSFDNESLNNVLKVFSSLSGLTYQINKNSVSLNLKNCKKA